MVRRVASRTVKELNLVSNDYLIIWISTVCSHLRLLQLFLEFYFQIYDISGVVILCVFFPFFSMRHWASCPFLGYQLHLSLVSYLLIEWLLISFFSTSFLKEKENVTWITKYKDVISLRSKTTILVMSQYWLEKIYSDGYRWCLWDWRNFKLELESKFM